MADETKPQKRPPYSPEWYQVNKAAIRESQKLWYKTHKSERLESCKRYRQANHAKVLEAHNKWKEKHRKRWVAYTNKRRALKKAATVNLKSINQWIESTRSKKSTRCYYCKKAVPSSKIQFDHIIALSKGGSHSVDNLCVSCRECNLSKSSRNIEAWVKAGQQILGL